MTCLGFSVVRPRTSLLLTLAPRHYRWQSLGGRHWQHFRSAVRTLMRKFYETCFLPVVRSGCCRVALRRVHAPQIHVIMRSRRVKPHEIEPVQKRVQNYLSRYPSSASEVRLLAVQADSVFPSEVQDLWIKLGRSQTSTSAYAQWRDRSPKLWCVLLVDQSTQLPLTNQGYVLANTPARGAIVQIGGHRALYVGTGSSGIF